MTGAVIPRQRGDDYQSRTFWQQGCRLFSDHTAVERVGFEIDFPKSFDDVAAWYRRPVPDGRRGTITAEYFQVKFHVDYAGAVTCESLVDPAFIGADKVCLLERIQGACEELSTLGGQFRLNLVLPWGIDPADALAEIVDGGTNLIRLNTLFDGTGPRGRMGKIRQAWCKRLGLTTDAELEKVLRPLRIIANAGSLDIMRQQLNTELQLAGFMPVADWQLGNPYDDLIRKLHAAGRNLFTRDELEQVARTEGLWQGQPILPGHGKDIGIRSFMKWADRMEDETEAMLCLCRHFDVRHIRDDSLWSAAVFPELSAFLTKEVCGRNAVTLRLDTHGTIAFTAGHCLDAKAGVAVTLVQKGHAGKVTWAPGGNSGRFSGPLWQTEDIPYPERGVDVAIAISVTHDVLPDVRHFVERCLPTVGRILHARIPAGTSSNAVDDGDHAAALAQGLVTSVRSARTDRERGGIIHVFAAAPNGLMFRMGQLSRAWGRLQLYEYDFDAGTIGGYRPSLSLPQATHGCAPAAGVK